MSGVGWTIGPDAVSVPEVLLQGLRGSTFRLELGGDGLPGIGASQTMRLVRIPTSTVLLSRLRGEIRTLGSLSGWARRHGISKGAVGNVEACTHDMTPAVAAAMGFERFTHLWRSMQQRSGS